MRRNKWVLAVLATVLLLALSGLGVGYGLWFEELFVDGEVQTGYLDAAWVQVWPCGDIEAYEPGWKDVGSVSSWVDAGDDNIMHFEIDNGYPLYRADCQLHYQYLGSIPVHVEMITFSPGPDLTGCTITQSPTTGSFTAECDQLIVKWTDGLCVQLHNGDEVAGSVSAAVKQAAAQSSSYTFDIAYQLNQYNESACP